jgi:hypothetical protein
LLNLLTMTDMVEFYLLKSLASILDSSLFYSDY